MVAIQENRHLAAIMSADVVGYTRLMRDDEADTIAALKRCVTVFQEIIAEHGGRVVDTAGDCVLAEFPSAVRAAECSIVLQDKLELQAAQQDESCAMRYRIGIHMGDVISDGNALYGDGVNVAARMEALADPGGICISGLVYEQIKDKRDFGFESIGRRTVKNVAEPIPVYKLYGDPASVPHRLFPRGIVQNRWLILIALILLLAAAAVTFYQTGSRSPEVPHRASTSLPGIVVLPFTNAGNDPQQDYFSQGITADITTDLSRLDSLRVIARQTAATYRGQSMSAQQVGNDLNIRYVLEGDIQKAGDRLRINVRLIDAEKEQLMWGERFDRDVGDIFAMQDEISQHVVSALSIELTDEQRKRLAHRYTQSVEAYDLFLRGQQAYVRQNANDNARAQRFFRQAIGLDPRFARAYAGLALTYSDDWRFEWSDAAEKGADQALQLARRAVALDEELPQAHWALGFVHLFRGEHTEAIEAAKRALALDPNNADAYVTLALSTTLAGDPERGIEFMGRAMDLNPRYGSRYSGVLGICYYHANRLEEAMSAFEDSLARNPARIPPYLYKTAIFMQTGREDDAQWQVAEVLTIDPDFTLRNFDRILPFGNTAKKEEFVALLRKAGFE